MDDAANPPATDVRRDHDGNVVSLVGPRCGQLFMLYSGRAGFPGTPLMRLLRETGLGNRNLTLLRDPHEDSFLSGVGARATDVEHCADWHADHLEALTHVHTAYCIGNSAGGIAAMLYGRYIGASSIWAFSPRPATQDTFDEALAYVIDMFSSTETTGPCELYYCPDNPIDREVAERLAACAGVRLHPREPKGHEDHTHLLMANMTRDGELRELLPAFEPAFAGEAGIAGESYEALDGAKDW